MKYYWLFFMILPNILWAQTHLKKQRFIELGMGGYDGLSTKNYSFQLGIGKYTQKVNTQSFTFCYSNKQSSSAQNEPFDIPVEQFILSYKRDFSLIKNYNNTFICSVFAQGNLGYEVINKNQSNFKEFELINHSDYLLGLGFGPNIEIGNLNIGLNSNLNFISNYQRFSTIPYLKYRFHI